MIGGSTDSSGRKQVVSVPTMALRPADSPRLGGENQQHTRHLAGLGVALPPILIDRRTMRVIDGTHRLAAAILRGVGTIAVEYFDGDLEEAFIAAVLANRYDCLPLTASDRKAAAARIVRVRPWWSDRTVAEIAGVPSGAIAVIRSRSTSTRRVAAKQAMDAHPDVPLRAAAQD